MEVLKKGNSARDGAQNISEAALYLPVRSWTYAPTHQMSGWKKSALSILKSSQPPEVQLKALRSTEVV